MHLNRNPVTDKLHEDCHCAGNMIEENLLTHVIGARSQIVLRYVCGHGSTEAVTGLQLDDGVIYVIFFRAGGCETFLSAHRIEGRTSHFVALPNAVDETLLEHGYSYSSSI